MNILVLGPNDSGKSAYAEKLLVKLAARGREETPGGPLVYIATMIPFGEEGFARVKKHRKQRQGLGFSTEERPCKVSEAEVEAGANLLVEDVSNLLSNLIFDRKANRPAEESAGDLAEESAEDLAFDDIKTLCEKCSNAVLVSIGSLKPDAAYDWATNEYIEALNRLNHRLAEFADVLVTMDEGKPTVTKGEENVVF